MADIDGAHTLQVEAERALCVEILLAAERYPSWYDTLDEVSALALDDEGRPATLRAIAGGGPLGAVEFHLRQTYRLPELIAGEQIAGNGKVVRVRNSWTLEALTATATRVTYRFAADAGGVRVRLALRAARALVERDLVSGFAEALKREAESRSGAARR